MPVTPSHPIASHRDMPRKRATAAAAGRAGDSAIPDTKTRKRGRAPYTQRSLYVSQSGLVLLEPRRRHRPRRRANDGGAGATDEDIAV
eukprot:285802-Rhodomonas_salina.1